MVTSSFAACDPGSRALRVLLVDDMPQVLHDLHQLLALTGAVEIVGEACDGAEAVTLALELAPDAVIMDLQMPVMDGYEATRRIKDQAPVTRVIVLSVHAAPEEQHRARVAGADRFIVKGASLEVFMDAIRGGGTPSNGLQPGKGEET